MKLRKSCPICGSKRYRVLFPKSFRENDLNQAVFSARRLPDRIHGTFMKCDKCDLVRTLEIIDSTKLKKLYEKSHFTYSNLVGNLKLSYTPILKKAIPFLKKRDSFLEIGCGNGFMLEEAKMLGFKKITGIEPSRDAIRQAKLNVRKFIKRDILRKGVFPPKSFDLIVGYQVFDHIPDPNDFLKICHSLLRPGGLLVLMNHDVEALSARILGEKSPIFDIEHPFLYGRQTISKILENNSFTAVEIYSPLSCISLRYLFQLFPLPSKIKHWILDLSFSPLGKNIYLPLGNLCVTARKRPLRKYSSGLQSNL